MIRHIVNFGLLFSFLTLAVTGILGFLLPFSIASTRVHIVFGLATLVLVGLHLASRLSYFKRQVSAVSGQKMPRWQLATLVGIWIGLLAVAVANWQPVRLFINQGYEAKHRAEIVRQSSLAGFHSPSTHQRIVARQPGGEADAMLSLSVNFASSLKQVPTIAIWAETSTGTMIETLYIDPTVAYSDIPRWGENDVPRHHILPIWRHRYTLLSGVEPTGEIDAFSGATPTHSFSLDDYLKLEEDNTVVLCVEVNLPGDSTEHFPDRTVGQPSLLYTAYIELDSDQPYTLLELTGHGGGAEDNGAIQYDLDNITTARRLIDLLLAKVEPMPASN